MLQDGEPSSSTIYMKPEDEIFEQASPQIRDVSIWSSWGLQRAPWVLQTPLEDDRCAWLALAVVEIRHRIHPCKEKILFRHKTSTSQALVSL